MRKSAMMSISLLATNTKSLPVLPAMSLPSPTPVSPGILLTLRLTTLPTMSKTSSIVTQPSPPTSSLLTMMKLHAKPRIMIYPNSTMKVRS